jgi:hypothetical protein
MASASSPFSNSSFDGQAIARIVGITCIIGFIVDMTALTFPMGSGAAWRVGLLQQMGDRSIVFLIGLALLLYSAWENRGLRKPLAYIGLAAGAVFLLFGILVIRDSFVLQSQAVDNIGNQASQLQTQVEESRSNPEIAANVAPEDFEEAARQINSRAEDLKQNAKTSITKTGIASVSNLFIVGIGLLSLGKVGIGRGSGVGASAQPSRKQRRRAS